MKPALARALTAATRLPRGAVRSAALRLLRDDRPALAAGILTEAAAQADPADWPLLLAAADAADDAADRPKKLDRRQVLRTLKTRGRP